MRPAMFSDTVEQLKSQYTDKYVKVDARRPELARFRDVVGQVKTVNMNGRALVEFLDYHLNMGWFDIDLSCLTVVEAPPKKVTAKPEAKRPHDKPEGKAAPTSGDKQVADAKAIAAAEKKLSPLELARMQGAGGKSDPAAPAKPASGGAPAGPKKSTADILAAARGGAAASVKPASGAPAAGKPTTADILAAARGKTASPAGAAPAPPAAPKVESPAAPAAPEPAPVAPAPAESPAGIVRVDKSSMTVDQIIAYCREHNAK